MEEPAEQTGMKKAARRTIARDIDKPVKDKSRAAFVTFMEGRQLDGLDVEREVDRGREGQLE